MPKLSPTLSAIFIIASRLVFAVLCFKAWQGQVGLTALLILFAAAVLFFVGKRGLKEEDQKSASFWAKGLFTVVGIMALLRHPIPCPKDATMCEPLPVLQQFSNMSSK